MDRDYTVRSDKIRYERIRRRMTQEQLARRAELSLGQLSRIENGASGTPRFSTIDKIAEALGVEADDLIEWRMPVPA